MGTTKSKPKHLFYKRLQEGASFPMKEVLAFNGCGEQHRWATCTKNPGHQNFIPVKDFQKTHLPKQFRNNIMFSWIKITCDLTVRLVARYTSKQRHWGDNLYKLRGTNCQRFGSGMVIHVEKEIDPKQTCPCAMCEKLTVKQKFTAKVYVSTACHVVFDESEAMKTEAELFYDDENDRESVRSLYGSRVMIRNEVEDICIFECITHDKDVANTLVKKLKSLRCVEQKFGRQMTYDMVNKNDETEATGILVDVSYPDGTKENLNIWQLGQPVKNTKKWLLEQAGFHRQHQNYSLVIDTSDDYSVDMEDEKIINDYWDDLTAAVRIWFRLRINTGSTCQTTTLHTGNGASPFPAEAHVH